MTARSAPPGNVFLNFCGEFFQGQIHVRTALNDQSIRVRTEVSIDDFKECGCSITPFFLWFKLHLLPPPFLTVPFLSHTTPLLSAGSLATCDITDASKPTSSFVAGSYTIAKRSPPKPFPGVMHVVTEWNFKGCMECELAMVTVPGFIGQCAATVAWVIAATFSDSSGRR
jgi:hypothetical protein